MLISWSLGLIKASGCGGWGYQPPACSKQQPSNHRAFTPLAGIVCKQMHLMHTPVCL